MGRRALLLCSLSIACAGVEDPCASPLIPVADDEEVSGVTVDAVRAWFSDEHDPVPLRWSDGRHTTLEPLLVIGDEGARRVSAPRCRETCRAPGVPAPTDCPPDRITTHTAALLATTDGALDGEPMVGRVWIQGHQWRAELVPSRGASLSGDLDVLELVDLAPDAFQMELRATLLGRRHRVEKAELRLHTLHDTPDGVEEHSARLAISR